MIYHNNILSLVSDYDYFVLDVWGVVHDGSEAYPYVIEHLQELKNLNKKICLLSNAPRRSFRIAEVLEKYGIRSDLYDFIITSGEATYQFLKDNQENNFKTFQANYYYIGPNKDIDLLDGLQYQITNDASLANFVINTGFDHDLSTIEEKLPDLEKAMSFNLPMICVNPDLVVIKKNGLEIPCAGIIAKKYEEMGGKVIYFGKPYSFVYEKVFELFKSKNKALQNYKRIIAVGDGPETDILGANHAGIDSALIGGGILANKLGINYGQLPDQNKIINICQQYQVEPKFIIAGL